MPEIDLSVTIVYFKRFINQSSSHMISAIILAGGNSTRMGSDKASLRFQGERFIDRIISIVGEFADDIIVDGIVRYLPV